MLVQSTVRARGVAPHSSGPGFHGRSFVPIVTVTTSARARSERSAASLSTMSSSRPLLSPGTDQFVLETVTPARRVSAAV
jgi:hypothetical protein